MRVEPDGSLLIGFKRPDARSTAKGLFYFMAVILTFQDSENEFLRLQVFKNKDNRCFISFGETNNSLYEGYCTLDSDDLTVLISELQSIKKSIDENE